MKAPEASLTEISIFPFWSAHHSSCDWFVAFAVNFTAARRQPWARSRLPFMVKMRLYVFVRVVTAATGSAAFENYSNRFDSVTYLRRRHVNALVPWTFILFPRLIHYSTFRLASWMSLCWAHFPFICTRCRSSLPCANKLDDCETCCRCSSPLSPITSRLGWLLPTEQKNHFCNLFIARRWTCWDRKEKRRTRQHMCNLQHAAVI